MQDQGVSESSTAKPDPRILARAYEVARAREDEAYRTYAGFRSRIEQQLLAGGSYGEGLKDAIDALTRGGPSRAVTRARRKLAAKSVSSADIGGIEDAAHIWRATGLASVQAVDGIMHLAGRSEAQPEAYAGMAELRQELTLLAQRLNPAVSLDFVREIWGEGPNLQASGAPDGIERMRVAGGYWRADAMIRVALDPARYNVLETTYHELWHSLEQLLSPEEQRVLAAELPARDTKLSRRDLELALSAANVPEADRPSLLKAALGRRANGPGSEVEDSIRRSLPPAEAAKVIDALPDRSTLVHRERVAYAFEQWAAARHRGEDKAPRGFAASAGNFLIRLGNWVEGRGFQTVEDIFRKGFDGELGQRAVELANRSPSAYRRLHAIAGDDEEFLAMNMVADNDNGDDIGRERARASAFSVGHEQPGEALRQELMTPQRQGEIIISALEAGYPTKAALTAYRNLVDQAVEAVTMSRPLHRLDELGLTIDPGLEPLGTFSLSGATGNRLIIVDFQEDGAIAGMKEKAPNDPMALKPSYRVPQGTENALPVSMQADAMVGSDHRLSPGFLTGAVGTDTRMRLLDEALDTVSALKLAGRPPTPEEAARLASYPGVGALPRLFDAPKQQSPAARDLRQRLEQVAGPGFANVERSVLNAHYTDPRIIQAVWDALGTAGMRDDPAPRVLEPGAGVGAWIGHRPDWMDARNIWAVEMEPIAAGIIGTLYPSAQLVAKPFETVDLPHGFFTASVGNVPFGDYSLFERGYAGLSIHDHFIAKSLDLTAPGGVVALLTSRYTLDRVDATARERLADQGELMTALRLPSGALGRAGTDVVADLLIMRKREKPLSAMTPAEAEQVRAAEPDWLTVSQVADPLGGPPMTVNSLFAARPDLVMGRLERIDTQFPGRDGAAGIGVTLVGDDGARLGGEAMRNAVAEKMPRLLAAALPAGSYRPSPGVTREDAARATAGIGLQQGRYTLVEGELLQRAGAEMVKPSPNPRQEAMIRDAITLDGALRQVLEGQVQGAEPQQREADRAALMSAYTDFTSRHGQLRSRPVARLLADDPVLCQLAGLERPGRDQNLADVFYRDVLAPEGETRAQTLAEATFVSLDRRGRLDAEFMAGLLGQEAPEKIESDLLHTGLAFKDPISRELVEAVRYLSGDVVGKLASAREAAVSDPAFTANVHALEAIQPPRIGHQDIAVTLGATWQGQPTISEFVRDLVGADAAQHLSVAYTEADASWHVSATKTAKREPGIDAWSVEGKAGGRRQGLDILQDALNDRRPLITATTRQPDGKTISVLDLDATMEARAKIASIQARFAGWIWSDPERTERLVDRYNDLNNRWREPVAAGEQLTFPGAEPSRIARMRATQRNGVHRILSQASTGLFHGVGAGKTDTYVAAAMKAKDLGLVRKPMLSVLAATLGQVTEDARSMYPGKQVLAWPEGNVTPADRRAFWGAVRTGDWDLVIVPHNASEALPLSPDLEARYLKEYAGQYKEAAAAIDAASPDDRGRPKAKRYERQAARLEARAAEMLKTGRQADAVYFDDIGVDMLMIDEAHRLKNLPTPTRHENVKGLPSGESRRSSRVEAQARYLEQTGGKFVPGTGSPISNSLAEAFTWQRFIQRELLKKAGLTHFDAWVMTFGAIDDRIELDVAGQPRLVQRLARFDNVPELQAMLRQSADIIPSSRIPGLKRPAAMVQAVIVPSTQDQLDGMTDLASRADAVRSGKVEPTDDNLLKISTDGRRLAMDPRLLADDAEPGGKVAAIATNVARIANDNPGTTQLVFFDYGVNAGKDSEFSFRDGLKAELAAQGLGPDKVLDFWELKEQGPDAVEQAKQRLREGTAVIGLGSTEILGTGVNVQDRLIALHNADVPWLLAHLQQRDGRGVRTGNLNEKVWIYRYVTEQSFDAAGWGLMAAKEAFIDQFLNGEAIGRSMVGDRDELLSAGEIAALAAGSGLLLSHARIGADIRALEAEVSGMTRVRTDLRERANRADAEAAALIGDAARHGPLAEAAWKAVDGGQAGSLSLRPTDGQQGSGAEPITGAELGAWLRHQQAAERRLVTKTVKSDQAQASRSRPERIVGDILGAGGEPTGIQIVFPARRSSFDGPAPLMLKGPGGYLSPPLPLRGGDELAAAALRGLIVDLSELPDSLNISAAELKERAGALRARAAEVSLGDRQARLGEHRRNLRRIEARLSLPAPDPRRLERLSDLAGLTPDDAARKLDDALERLDAAQGSRSARQTAEGEAALWNAVLQRLEGTVTETGGEIGFPSGIDLRQPAQFSLGTWPTSSWPQNHGVGQAKAQEQPSSALRRLPVGANENGQGIIGQPDLAQEIANLATSLSSGAELPRGVLFAGPSGTGKTMAIEVLAALVPEIPVFATSGTRLESSFIGGTSEVIHRTFDEVRRAAARHGAAVLFIDELDQIGSREELLRDGSMQHRRELVNAMLEEMNGAGLQSQSGRIVVIAATNRPDDIDPALRRPGRFDFTIQTHLPDVQGRIELLTRRLAGHLGSDLDTLVRGLAERSSGASQAALDGTVREAFRLAKLSSEPLSATYLELAERKVRPGRPSLPADRQALLDLISRTITSGPDGQVTDEGRSAGSALARRAILAGLPGTKVFEPGAAVGPLSDDAARAVERETRSLVREAIRTGGAQYAIDKRRLDLGGKQRPEQSDSQFTLLTAELDRIMRLEREMDAARRLGVGAPGGPPVDQDAMDRATDELVNAIRGVSPGTSKGFRTLITTAADAAGITPAEMFHAYADYHHGLIERNTWPIGSQRWADAVSAQNSATDRLNASPFALLALPTLSDLMAFGGANIPDQDVLGPVARDLGLLPKGAEPWVGVSPVKDLQIRLTLPADDIRRQIEARGYVAAAAPYEVAGQTTLGLAQAVREAGYDPSKHLHVQPFAPDPLLFKLTHIQSSCAGVPATVSDGHPLQSDARLTVTPALLRTPGLFRHSEALPAYGKAVAEGEKLFAEGHRQRARAQFSLGDSYDLQFAGSILENHNLLDLDRAWKVERLPDLDASRLAPSHVLRTGLGLLDDLVTAAGEAGTGIPMGLAIAGRDGFQSAVDIYDALNGVALASPAGLAGARRRAAIELKHLPMMWPGDSGTLARDFSELLADHADLPSVTRAGGSNAARQMLDQLGVAVEALAPGLHTSVPGARPSLIEAAAAAADRSVPSHEAVEAARGAVQRAGDPRRLPGDLFRARTAMFLRETLDQHLLGHAGQDWADAARAALQADELAVAMGIYRQQLGLPVRERARAQYSVSADHGHPALAAARGDWDQAVRMIKEAPGAHLTDRQLDYLGMPVIIHDSPWAAEVETALNRGPMAAALLESRRRSLALIDQQPRMAWPVTPVERWAALWPSCLSGDASTADMALAQRDLLSAMAIAAAIEGAPGSWAQLESHRNKEPAPVDPQRVEALDRLIATARMTPRGTGFARGTPTRRNKAPTMTDIAQFRIDGTTMADNDQTWNLLLRSLERPDFRFALHAGDMKQAAVILEAVRDGGPTSISYHAEILARHVMFDDVLSSTLQQALEQAGLPSDISTIRANLADQRDETANRLGIAGPNAAAIVAESGSDLNLDILQADVSLAQSQGRLADFQANRAGGIMLGAAGVPDATWAQDLPTRLQEAALGLRNASLDGTLSADLLADTISSIGFGKPNPNDIQPHVLHEVAGSVAGILQAAASVPLAAMPTWLREEGRQPVPGSASDVAASLSQSLGGRIEDALLAKADAVVGRAEANTLSFGSRTWELAPWRLTRDEFRIQALNRDPAELKRLAGGRLVLQDGAWLEAPEVGRDGFIDAIHLASIAGATEDGRQVPTDIAREGGRFLDGLLDARTIRDHQPDATPATWRMPDVPDATGPEIATSQPLALEHRVALAGPQAEQAARAIAERWSGTVAAVRDPAMQGSWLMMFADGEVAAKARADAGQSPGVTWSAAWAEAPGVVVSPAGVSVSLMGKGEPPELYRLTRLPDGRPFARRIVRRESTKGFTWRVGPGRYALEGAATSGLFDIGADGMVGPAEFTPPASYSVGNLVSIETAFRSPDPQAVKAEWHAARGAWLADLPADEHHPAYRRLMTQLDTESLAAMRERGWEQMDVAVLETHGDGQRILVRRPGWVLAGTAISIVPAGLRTPEPISPQAAVLGRPTSYPATPSDLTWALVHTNSGQVIRRSRGLSEDGDFHLPEAAVKAAEAVSGSTDWAGITEIAQLPPGIRAALLEKIRDVISPYLTEDMALSSERNMRDQTRGALQERGFGSTVYWIAGDPEEPHLDRAQTTYHLWESEDAALEATGEREVVPVVTRIDAGAVADLERDPDRLQGSVQTILREFWEVNQDQLKSNIADNLITRLLEWDDWDAYREYLLSGLQRHPQVLESFLLQNNLTRGPGQSIEDIPEIDDALKDRRDDLTVEFVYADYEVDQFLRDVTIGNWDELTGDFGGDLVGHLAERFRDAGFQGMRYVGNHWDGEPVLAAFDPALVEPDWPTLKETQLTRLDEKARQQAQQEIWRASRTEAELARLKVTVQDQLSSFNIEALKKEGFDVRHARWLAVPNADLPEVERAHSPIGAFILHGSPREALLDAPPGWQSIQVYSKPAGRLDLRNAGEKSLDAWPQELAPVAKAMREASIIFQGSTAGAEPAAAAAFARIVLDPKNAGDDPMRIFIDRLQATDPNIRSLELPGDRLLEIATVGQARTRLKVAWDAADASGLRRSYGLDRDGKPIATSALGTLSLGLARAMGANGLHVPQAVQISGRRSPAIGQLDLSLLPSSTVAELLGLPGGSGASPPIAKNALDRRAEVLALVAVLAPDSHIIWQTQERGVLSSPDQTHIWRAFDQSATALNRIAPGVGSHVEIGDLAELTLTPADLGRIRHLAAAAGIPVTVAELLPDGALQLRVTDEVGTDVHTVEPFRTAADYLATRDQVAGPQDQARDQIRTSLLERARAAAARLNRGELVAIMPHNGADHVVLADGLATRASTMLPDVAAAPDSRRYGEGLLALPLAHLERLAEQARRSGQNLFVSTGPGRDEWRAVAAPGAIERPREPATPPVQAAAAAQPAAAAPPAFAPAEARTPTSPHQGPPPTPAFTPLERDHSSSAISAAPPAAAAVDFVATTWQPEAAAARSSPAGVTNVSFRPQAPAYQDQQRQHPTAGDTIMSGGQSSELALRLADLTSALNHGGGSPIDVARKSGLLNDILLADMPADARDDILPLSPGYVAYRDGGGRWASASIDDFIATAGPDGHLAGRYSPALLDQLADYGGRHVADVDATWPEKLAALRGDIVEAVRSVNPGIEIHLTGRLYGVEDVVVGGAQPGGRKPLLGLYFAHHQAIAVSTDVSRGNPLSSAYHELFHSVEGLLTDKERQAVERQFGTGGPYHEAAAEAFGEWAADRAKARKEGRPPEGEGVFRSLGRFVERMNGVLEGRGFRTWDDVFEDALAGKVAARGKTFDVTQKVEAGVAAEIAEKAGLPRLAKQYRDMSAYDGTLAGRAAKLLRGSKGSAKKEPVLTGKVLVDTMRQYVNDASIRAAIQESGYQIKDTARITGLLKDRDAMLAADLKGSSSTTPVAAGPASRPGPRPAVAARGGAPGPGKPAPARQAKPWEMRAHEFTENIGLSKEPVRNPRYGTQEDREILFYPATAQNPPYRVFVEPGSDRNHALNDARHRLHGLVVADALRQGHLVPLALGEDHPTLAQDIRATFERHIDTGPKLKAVSDPAYEPGVPGMAPTRTVGIAARAPDPVGAGVPMPQPVQPVGDPFYKSAGDPFLTAAFSGRLAEVERVYEQQIAGRLPLGMAYGHGLEDQRASNMTAGMSVRDRVYLDVPDNQRAHAMHVGAMPCHKTGLLYLPPQMSDQHRTSMLQAWPEWQSAARWRDYRAVMPHQSVEAAQAGLRHDPLNDAWYLPSPRDAGFRMHPMATQFPRIDLDTPSPAQRIQAHRAAAFYSLGSEALSRRDRSRDPVGPITASIDGNVSSAATVAGNIGAGAALAGVDATHGIVTVRPRDREEAEIIGWRMRTHEATVAAEAGPSKGGADAVPAPASTIQPFYVPTGADAGRLARQQASAWSPQERALRASVNSALIQQQQAAGNPDPKMVHELRRGLQVINGMDKGKKIGRTSGGAER